jgi:hypothetical protein
VAVALTLLRACDRVTGFVLAVPAAGNRPDGRGQRLQPDPTVMPGSMPTKPTATAPGEPRRWLTIQTG